MQARTNNIIRAFRIGMWVKPVMASLLLVGLCAGCATFFNDRPEVEMEEIRFSSDEAGSPNDRFNQYLIAAGDILDVTYHINAWDGLAEFRLSVDNEIEVKFPEMPDLNETTVIRPDGNISLPYLGEVRAVGMTVAELTAQLKKRYAGILKKPELFVAVTDFRFAIREFKADMHTSPRGLSRLVTVRPDGCATFAMLGDRVVAGRTFDDVRQEVNQSYARIMPGLSVDLFLDEHSGSRIYVLGQVTTPGAYEIQRPTSVIEALALAGSPLRSAKLGSVVIIRRRDEKMIGMRVDARSALHLRKNSVFFYLKPNDIVYVPKRTISKIGDIAMDVQRILFFNGWGFYLEFDPFRKDLVPTSTSVRTDEWSATDVDVDGNSTTRSSTTETRDTDYEYKKP